MTRTYDIHVHTRVSPCSRNEPEDIIDRAVAAGLDGIAVTDHDSVQGGVDVATLAPPELEIIVGAELTTSQGHLLALGIDETPPVGTETLDAIQFVHDHSGVAVLAHPFDSFRQTYQADLEAIADAVDGVEVKNSRCLLTRFNTRAEVFADEHDLPVTGGSDAHFPMEVGRAVTRCEGPLLEAIRSGKSTAAGRDGYLSGHVATKLNDALSLLGR
ncbi:hypothetical protein SAMN04488065_2897 [Haloplanus vescus]|uniref:Polymerase/histidinol phosphatase N-terminal domain-containing protein n=1 Tax=Haloplanus vescus TaxID=555874 RepID=A0A1H4AQH8_9EURY|nr:PHP domain-containing protein [Haloplanus vescus]SEA38146.1 hypothetical protein SAMN04488065_2897 [Haloplanus vescus]